MENHDAVIRELVRVEDGIPTIKHTVALSLCRQGGLIANASMCTPQWFAGDGTGFLMTGSADKTLKVWDIPSSKGPKKKRAQQTLSAEGVTRAVSRYTAAAHEKDINAVAVAPNSRILATGSQDRCLKIWSAVDGTLQGICRGHKRGIWSVAFSPVDKAVATASGDAAVKIWSVSDCK